MAWFLAECYASEVTTYGGIEIYILLLSLINAPLSTSLFASCGQTADFFQQSVYRVVGLPLLQKILKYSEGFSTVTTCRREYGKVAILHRSTAISRKRQSFPGVFLYYLVGIGPGYLNIAKMVWYSRV